MASYEDCLAAIMGKQAEGALTKQQAEEILQAIDDLAQKKKADGSLVPLEQVIMTEVGQMASEMKIAALVQKRNALINHAIRKKALFQVNQFKNPGEGLLSLLVGSVKSKFGSKFSVDAQIHALQSEFVGKLVQGLEADDLLPAFANGKLDEEIAQELWNLPHGKEPVSGSPEAFKIAKLINNLQIELVARQNRAGAWIHLMPGYIVRQSHDMAKVRSAGKEAWIDYVLPRLNAEQTFGTLPTDKYRDFLSGVYDGLATGIHYRTASTVEQDSSYTLLGFKGPKNLAKKVSQERVLHFKDASNWFQYNAVFGHGNLREAVVAGLDNSARNLGLMQALGTNPKAMVERLLSDVRRASKGDIEAIDAISDIKVMNRFKELDGTTNIPDSISMAKVGRTMRILQNVSKLGGALISSITDLPTQVAEMRYQGVPLLNAWFNAFWNPIRGRGAGEQREIAQLLGVGFDGLIGNAISRFDASDNLPGTMSKLQQRFFKLNGMNYWNDAHMAGVTLMSSAHIGSHAEKAWEDVPKSLQNLLSQYAIGEKEWPLIKGMLREHDGNKYIMPDELNTQLGRELVKKHLGLTDKVHTSPDMVGTEIVFDKNPQTNKVLNGVPFKEGKVKDFSKIKDKGLGADSEADFMSLPLTKASGAVVVEPDGRVWIYEPANHYGGYEHTFPKGTLEKGLSLEQNAIKEVFEETGLEIELVDFVGDFKGDTSVTRYYLAKRVGGAPWTAHWEADKVKLVDMATVGDTHLNKARDRKLIEFVNFSFFDGDASFSKYGDISPKKSSDNSRKIREAMEGIQLKVRTLFSDRARTAIPHPGAAERAMMNQGTQPGTVLGEALRLFMQFKSFPISVVRKGLGREIYGSGADTIKEALLQGKGDILGLVHFMAATTLFGYAAMSLKDIAKGREPRDPTDPKTIAAAMTQGGGLGIYGDFLFGEFSRYGRSFAATLAGPTFGQLDDIAEIYTRIRTGEDALPQAFRMMINNTPFMNLFYTRSAMDYLILYQLQEMVSPGYLHRLEARIRRENDQEFFLPPSSVVPYGGGDVPFESLLQ